MSHRPILSIALLLATLSAPARGDVAGTTSTGSTAYTNGGLSFIGDAPLASSNTRGQYAAAIDPAAANMLTASQQGYLTKLSLGAAGAPPTVITTTTSLTDNIAGNGGGPISHYDDMFIDARSAILSQHYVYATGSTGTGDGSTCYLIKVQMDPPDAAYPQGDPLAQPKVVTTIKLPIPTAVTTSAVDLVNGYAYFTTFNNGTLVQMNLNDNSIKTVSGLPANLNYWQMGLSNNTLYIADSTQIQKITLGAGGALPVVLNSSNLSALSVSNATFYVDPDPAHPYAYTATNPYVFGTAYTNLPSTVTRINLGGSGAMSIGPSRSIGLPDTSFYASLGAFDPDSHTLLMGTDNALPGSISKINGEAAGGPALLGSIDLPTYGAVQPPIYTSGDLNIRSAVIDPQTGYAFFGTDAGANHIIKVQYSQKGSIKGDKVYVPAGAQLTAVNFYSNMPAAASTYSSGNVRLAIYGDNGGSPGSLVWQSGDIADSAANGVSSSGGWLSVSSGLPTISTAGNYWLAWQVDSTLDVPGYSGGTAGSGFTFNQAYGAFPASLSGSASIPTLTADQWSMNVQYNLTISSGTAVWTSTSGSLWSSNSGWTDQGGTVHAAPGLSAAHDNLDEAIFDGTGTALSVSLSAVSPRLKTLSFSNSSYTLTGGSLALKSNSGTASIAISSGTQTLDGSVALLLDSNVVISPSHGSRLMIAGNISGSGALSLAGPGVLILSGSANNFSGGTAVSAGTLILADAGALPDNSMLSVGDASAFSSAPVVPNAISPTPSYTPVPEPATLAMVAVAMVMLMRRAFVRR